MIPSPTRVASRFKPRLVGRDRALHSVLHDAVGANPRPLKDSDFVDAIHATHPPYVSLFRADRYMAGHIARLLPKGSSTVVPRLDMLLGSIRKLTA